VLKPANAWSNGAGKSRQHAKKIPLPGNVLGPTFTLFKCRSAQAFARLRASRTRDPGSSAEYYTTAIKKSGSAVEFKDSKTLTNMTLQNSQVSEITKDQYSAATGQH